jgi:hypothetical protein
MEQIRKPHIVYFMPYFCVNIEQKRYETTHWKVNKYDFDNKSFNEILRENESEIRSYFDFDFHEKTDLQPIIDTLNRLKECWGEYACVGYSNDESIFDIHTYENDNEQYKSDVFYAKYKCHRECDLITRCYEELHLQFVEKAHKFASFHVYFYQALAKREDLNKLRTEFKRLHMPYDPTVYSNGQKAFRHPLSAKQLTFNTTIDSNTSVRCPQNMKPSQLLIQPDGNEIYEATFEQFAMIAKITPTEKQSIHNYGQAASSNGNFDEIIAKISAFNDEKHIPNEEWMSLNGCISCYPLDDEIKAATIIKHQLYYYSPSLGVKTDENDQFNYPIMMNRKNNNQISTSSAIHKWMNRNII